MKAKIEYIRSKKTRRLRMRMNKAGIIRVTYPWYIPKSRAVQFVNQHSDWIHKQTQRFNEVNSTNTIVPGRTLKALNYTLNWIEGESQTTFFSGQEITLSIPPNTPLRLLEKQLEDALIQIALPYFQCETERIAQTTGYAFNEVKVGRAKGKWGSCTHDNRLRFSCYAILLPDHLRRHLILHELVHTVHKNHGSSFHSTLNQHNPNSRTDEKALKSWKIRLF